MISYRIKIPRVLRGLLTRPEKEMVKMFGLDKVNSQLPRLIKAMISRNYASKENEDGSAWASWTAATEDIRGRRGLAKLKPKKLAKYGTTMLRASGDYYRDLKNLDFSQMKLTTVDQLWHVNNLALMYINPDDIPGLWNEFEHITRGAINTNTLTPIRQMLYFDENFTNDIVSIMKSSLDNYWR